SIGAGFIRPLQFRIYLADKNANGRPFSVSQLIGDGHHQMKDAEQNKQYPQVLGEFEPTLQGYWNRLKLLLGEQSSPYVKLWKHEKRANKKHPHDSTVIGVTTPPAVMTDHRRIILKICFGHIKLGFGKIGQQTDAKEAQKHE
ncbi:hypothetical protein, partial [Pseudomonas sp. MWU13-2100]|uniref:hypothetical protein n=1 Tax=Pseudomonas sp. MWU13-2100 TaxID=2935075 RepID=UPI00200F2B53